MTEKTHSATISPAEGTFVAKVGGVTVARTAKAKILQEANSEKTYRPVVYFPLADVERDYLISSAHRSHCPIKGDAGYYNIEVGGETLENAAWYYPIPFPMVTAIKDHLAFYPDKVNIEQA